MTPKVLYKFPQCAGQSFQPSNGTEGMIFTGAFCDNCMFEKFTHTQNDADMKCDILSATMLYSTKDKEYPREWVYDSEGWPVCTKWKKWDWGFDDDKGEWNDPEIPDPIDPNQLDLFPLHPDERSFNKESNDTLQEEQERKRVLFN